MPRDWSAGRAALEVAAAWDDAGDVWVKEAAQLVCDRKAACYARMRGEDVEWKEAELGPNREISWDELKALVQARLDRAKSPTPPSPPPAEPEEDDVDE